MRRHDLTKKALAKTILETCDIWDTILTVENLKSWQSLLPDNKEWQWTAFAILASLLFAWQISDESECLYLLFFQLWSVSTNTDSTSRGNIDVSRGRELILGPVRLFLIFLNFNWLPPIRLGPHTPYLGLSLSSQTIWVITVNSDVYYGVDWDVLANILVFNFS